MMDDIQDSVNEAVRLTRTMAISEDWGMGPQRA
jgi:hypothetical protein